MAKRELIDTGTDNRHVRRSKLGTSFVESDDVGRSLARIGDGMPKPRSPQKLLRWLEPTAAGSARAA